MPAARPAAMRFILITVLIDMVSIGLIVPVLPLIVGTFTASPTEQTFWFGVVTFSFGLANFLASPVLGALSDRYGRRPVLLLGFTGLATSFFVTGLATALWMLIAVRLFSGAMQSNAAVANAYVADITAPEDRARRFGLLGAMFGLGFILGPAAGGLLGAIDVHLPFFVAGTLAVLNGLYGWFVLPESLPPERRRPFEWRRANPVSALRGLAALRGVGSLVAVIGLASLAQFTLHTSWVLYTTFKFGWGPAQNGASLFFVGLTSAFVQGFLLKHLLARFSPQRLASVGLVASSLTYLGFGLASQGWMMYAVILVGTLIGGGAQAAMQSLVSNAAGATEQGRTMGAVASLNSLSAVLAPVLSATLLGLVSHRPQGDAWIGLPFFFCALMQAVGASIAISHFRRHRREASAAAAA
ncbi:tetracycline-efflux transporter [Piscinibacter sakaiensis]|uniref:Tetracycline-efflux transporter n=1 Tax=Piscinibacter sakaiensis TaxID=1547922 RepID=A0A0K8P6P8_PISS1|nr:tetracycline-efflux transporter [Piscinibacter sakaiensis]